MHGFRVKDTRALVDCATGRAPADTVIRDGRWICVQTGEIIPHTDIAILNGRIAYVGASAAHCIGAQTRVVEATGRYLVPGLLDAHMHVESGMLTVSSFARAVMVRGTTAMFIDPHEIANVFGLPGVRMMVDEAALQPIHVWVQVPSCVPSAPGFEQSGAALGPQEIAEALSWDGVVGLGELMNFPAVVAGDAALHAELDATRAAGKVIGGHYASPDLGLPFHAYAAGGAQDDHEGTSLADAIERARQGMKVMMRYGSAWHDVAEQMRAVTEAGLDARSFLLCTDDSHSETLVAHGHMDRVLRHAIGEGLPPMLALQMATINAAEHFGMSTEIGQIAPGRWADVLLVDDLRDFRPAWVMARGVVVAQDCRPLVEPPAFVCPDWAKDSVKLPRALSAADFRLSAPHASAVTANVIGVIENQAPTRHMRVGIETQSGEVSCLPQRDLAKLAVVERYRNTGSVSVGLVHGFGFDRPCAVASSVSHDSHQVIVAGSDEACMAQAVNALAVCGGGQVVVIDGEVRALVKLPIGGLMSAEPAAVVAQQAGAVLQAFRDCGCHLNNPNMQLSLLALPVIPELRLSGRGLLDVQRMQFIPVLE